MIQVAKLTTKSALKTARDHQCALDLIDDLGKLMHQLNRDNVLALVAEYTRSHAGGGMCPHPNYPYANLHAALAGALRLLGVPDGDSMESALMEVFVNREPAANVVKAHAVDQ